MKMFMFVLSIVFTTFLLYSAVSGQQLSYKNCSSYIQLNVADYGYNISSKNPLGFNSSVLPYMDGKYVTPCVSVTGVPSDAYIEVKCETSITGAQICIGNQQGLRICGSGRLNSCFTSPATSIKFAFYCEPNCEQNDVAFWYRIIASKKNPSDQWCSNRPSDDYPSSLAVAPTHLPTLPPRINPGGKGCCHGSSFVMVSFLSMLVIWISYIFG